MPKNEKKIEHYRDAKTGEYVTPEYAKKHPSTTVKETDKIKTPSPKKK